MGGRGVQEGGEDAGETGQEVVLDVGCPYVRFHTEVAGGRVVGIFPGCGW